MSLPTEVLVLAAVAIVQFLMIRALSKRRRSNDKDKGEG